jgi:hypothetical protein
VLRVMENLVRVRRTRVLLLRRAPAASARGWSVSSLVAEMERRAAVEALVELRGEIPRVLSEARSFPPDLGEPLVTIMCAHIDSIGG